MANMNVKKRLEKIGEELDQLVAHIAQYRGIDKRDARIIDTMATSLAAQAARIAGEARTSLGEERSAHIVVKKVRKALGFSYP